MPGRRLTAVRDQQRRKTTQGKRTGRAGVRSGNSSGSGSGGGIRPPSHAKNTEGVVAESRRRRGAVRGRREFERFWTRSASRSLYDDRKPFFIQQGVVLPVPVTAECACLLRQCGCVFEKELSSDTTTPYITSDSNNQRLSGRGVCLFCFWEGNGDKNRLYTSLWRVEAACPL